MTSRRSTSASGSVVASTFETDSAQRADTTGFPPQRTRQQGRRQPARLDSRRRYGDRIPAMASGSRHNVRARCSRSMTTEVSMSPRAGRVFPSQPRGLISWEATRSRSSRSLTRSAAGAWRNRATAVSERTKRRRRSGDSSPTGTRLRDYSSDGLGAVPVPGSWSPSLLAISSSRRRSCSSHTCMRALSSRSRTTGLRPVKSAASSGLA